MKCPRCGNEYHSKYDICKNCYLELKEQFTQEAKEQHEKYKQTTLDEWNYYYKLAYDEALKYNRKKYFSMEMVLPYFIEKYIYYKMLEYVKPIHERQRKKALEYSKLLIERLAKYDKNQI